MKLTTNLTLIQNTWV